LLPRIQGQNRRLSRRMARIVIASFAIFRKRIL
jgi:hypothetical protein